MVFKDRYFENPQLNHVNTMEPRCYYIPLQEVELDVEILIQPYWMRSEYWWDEDNEE